MSQHFFMLVKKYKNKIKQISAVLFLVCILFSAVFFIVKNVKPALAQDLDVGMNYAENLDLASSDTDIRIIIINIIKYLLTFLGIIAVAMVMYAGFLWMTSEGDPDKVNKAKKTLVNAVIGLIIIISAFAIVIFIYNLINDGHYGGPGNGSDPQGVGPGYGAIGSCTIENVYPEPEQKEVSRNTSIIVTFKERIATSTICDNNIACNNSDINIDNIRIFHKNDVSCQAEPCPSLVSDVKVYSNDNKTFVFVPTNYLGSPSEYIWYSVYLSNAITTEGGEPVFKNCYHDYFKWDFEISNKIDLTPPQVNNSGVFPAPDDNQDTATESGAVQATGNITINGNLQSRVFATAGTPSPSTAYIENLNISHNQTGTLLLAINTDGITASLSNNTTGFLLGSAEVSGDSVTFSDLFTLVSDSGTFNPGDSWTIQVTSAEQPDILTVGSNQYIFVDSVPNSNEIQVGATVSLTAQNIANKLSTNSLVEVFPVYSGGAVINLRAKTAGNNGNDITLSVNSGAPISFTQMSGGSASSQTVTVNDRSDKPRNATIQINFNEAINPITVSGNAQDVDNYIAVKCLSINGVVCNSADDGFFDCNGDVCVEGHFEISNQYKTVEFISDNQCGANACGEPIYCLPGNSSLRVDLVAANLLACSDNSDCVTRSPYNTCNSYCQNSDNENYPLSLAMDGIMDVCLNSFDGDRSGDAEGPLVYYNENLESGAGDNYQWLFWINSIIDITPPEILTTSVNQSDTGIDLVDSIFINFDKLMMSSSLKTGKLDIFNGQEYVEHKSINIWNLANYPIGYWIANKGIDDSSPSDGEMDWTKAEIRHSTFRENMSYRSQIGSGVKDIYQNCFKPSIGPACVGMNEANPTCCSGVLSTNENCN